MWILDMKDYVDIGHERLCGYWASTEHVDIGHELDHVEPKIIQIDRRSMTKYGDTLSLMRYNNHFMYIKNLNQIRHSYRCKKCSKFCKNMEACNRHEKNVMNW
jgi:hypothetical protein